MTTFFAELKHARELRKMSLTDIADATLINVRFLEALEQGDTTMLPEAYVRAFIREYASTVGLDPTETMRKFDELRVPEHHTTPSSAPPPDAPEAPTAVTTLHFSPKTVRIAGLVVGIGAIAVLVWNLTGSGGGNDVTEIPFRAVLREHEQRLMPPPPDASPHGALDSLTLRATVIDTVWMTVTVDSTAPREYLFRPGARALWKARDQFVLTLGSGGAVLFALNDRQIGALGKRGSVVRNVSLSRATLAGP